MGRKRTSSKQNITLSVDTELIEKLRLLEVDRSLIFTEAAKEYLESLSQIEESEKQK